MALWLDDDQQLAWRSLATMMIKLRWPQASVWKQALA